jgi:acyl-CoA synthetase (AMP-forming)/AMP-acid ligase II
VTEQTDPLRSAGHAPRPAAGHALRPAVGDALRPAENVHGLLDAAVAQAPESTAVRDSRGAWSYARLAEYSRAVEAWLAGRGVGRGDRVVVQAATRRETVAVMFGVLRRGAIFVPLNPAMKPFHLAAVLENAGAMMVLADPAGVERVRSAAATPVIAMDAMWDEVEDLRRAGARAPAVDVSARSVAALVYTSGSTATPKAVVCPHAQMVFASASINAVLGYRPDDVVFCRFPLSWDYGLYKVPLSCLGRSELVLADDATDLRLLREIRQTGATIVPIVPSLASIVVTLARRDPEPVSRVRLLTNTGAALPQPAIEALRTIFPAARIVRQFGQTECKRISIMPPEEDGERPQSVGLPLPGTRVRILDEAGEPVPTGEVGEITVLGPHVMPGYWRAPELTDAAFRRDEETGEPRLHTGDYGHVDEDGYLYFEGRRDDMFKRKGIRMSTLEIEAAALDVDGVHAAVAVPPSEADDLVLFVVADVPGHRVIRELAQRLEPAKVPAVCRVVDEIPLTTNGKYARRALLFLIESGA